MQDHPKLSTNQDEQPSVVNDDPETIEALNQLLLRENEFFSQHCIMKRKDGSYWARLAVQPTDEQIESGTTEQTKGIIYNRGSLIEYFEKHLTKLNTRTLPLCLPTVERHFLKTPPDPSIPFEYIIGTLSKFRIKQYPNHKELHCEVKIHKQDPLIFTSDLCAGLYTYRKHKYQWEASEVVQVVHFFLSKPFDVNRRREENKHHWRPEVLRAMKHKPMINIGAGFDIPTKKEQ